MKKTVLFWLFIIFLLAAGLIAVTYFQKDRSKKLVFWSIQLKPVYEKQMYDIIKVFEKNHPQYKVVWVDIPIQEAQKRTLASILSSNPPDIVNLNPDFSIILAQKNALYNFTEKDAKDFLPALVNKLKYKGKIYALPFYATSPVTIYNKEIYNKCVGSSFIKSYSELDTISKKLKSCSNIPVFSGSINENDNLSKILNKYNVYDLNSDYQLQKTIEIYSLFNGLYKSNELPKDILSINHRENIEKYMSNQALIVVAGSNFINMIKQNAPEIYSKSEISQQLTGDNEKYDVSLMNLIIPLKSKNKQMALEFIKILTEKDNQLEFAKITNVLPANKYALNNDYFKNCSSDLYEKSRCVGAKQLNNLVQKDFGDENKKLINEKINKVLEEILLNDGINQSQIKEKVEKLSKEVKLLQSM